MRLNCKMDFDKNFRNEMFKRQELMSNIESDKNPSFEEVRKMIAEETGKPEDNVHVTNVRGSFGSNVFCVEAYVYDSKEDFDSIKKMEMTSKERKEAVKAVEEAKKAEGEAKKAEAEGKEVFTEESKEEPKDEKPVEEKSEIPVEEKPEQIEEKPEEKPVEAPVEERPEEEVKAVKEEEQKKEESKE